MPDDEVISPYKDISLKDLIDLVPRRDLRIKCEALYGKYDSWKDVQEVGARMFFERTEFLYVLATSIPLNPANASYIKYIGGLIKNSAEMFKLWLDTSAVPELTAAVERLQADVEVLEKLIKKHCDRETGERILEDWRLERLQGK